MHYLILMNLRFEFIRVRYLHVNQIKEFWAFFGWLKFKLHHFQSVLGKSRNLSIYLIAYKHICFALFLFFVFNFFYQNFRKYLGKWLYFQKIVLKFNTESTRCRCSVYSKSDMAIFQKSFRVSQKDVLWNL